MTHIETVESMGYKLSTSNVAVSLEVAWQPMATCPIRSKVQLLSIGGLPSYGRWDGEDTFYVGWAPVPYRDPAIALVPVQRAAK